MRTSLNNIKHIEEFLEGTMSLEDSLLFHAKMIVSPALRREVRIQKQAYSVIRLYGRKLVRQQIQDVHQEIFNDSSDHPMKHQVSTLFTKP